MEHARLRAIDDAAIDGGFWADRQRLNHDVLIPDGARRLEEAGNFGNLRAAAGRSEEPFRGMVFHDSDVYKWLEALGHELAREPSPELAAPGRRGDRSDRAPPSARTATSSPATSSSAASAGRTWPGITSSTAPGT